MANTIDLLDPNSNDNKANHRRRFSMELLLALGLEKLLNVRVKGLIEAYFPSKKPALIEEDTDKLEIVKDTSEEPAEINLLVRLVEQIYKATLKFVSNVKDNVINRITQAAKANKISQPTARILISAVENTLNPKLVDDTIEILKNPEEAETKINEEINAIEDEETREHIKEVHRNRNQPRPEPKAHEEKDEVPETAPITLENALEIRAMTNIYKAAEEEINTSTNNSKINPEEIRRGVRLILQEIMPEAFEKERSVYFNERRSILLSMNPYNGLLGHNNFRTGPSASRIIDIDENVLSGHFLQRYS